MRLRILAVGNKMPAWVDEGVAEYARRIPREFNVEWMDIPAAKRGRATALRYQELEAEALRAKLGDDYLVTLDVQGREVSTEMIAERFGQWQMEGRRVGIVIGGPDGLHDSILKSSQEQWSFGRITMPHPLVRVILSEQIYRAWSVQTGHPYHRAN